MKVLVVAAALVVGGILVYMLDRHRCIKTARMLAQREPLDDTSVYRQFYAASALPESDVIELWHEIATMLGVPPGQRRPADVLGRGKAWGQVLHCDIGLQFRA